MHYPAESSKKTRPRSFPGFQVRSNMQFGKADSNGYKVAVLEGVTRSPPFQGELMLMLIGYFGLTLLHAQKEGSYV